MGASARPLELPADTRAATSLVAAGPARIYLWLVILYFVLEYAPTLPGARRCRVGADGHWLPIFVAEYIKQREGRLSVSIDADNWVTFHDDQQG